MKSYSTILFDLDGTLSDLSQGIINSIIYALEKYDVNDYDMPLLRKFLGPPLHESFEKFMGFDKEKSLQAVKFYREYFSSKGLFENEIYGGVSDLLQNLKEIEEPFEKNQIGSSAMAYKRNPMRSERIASLSRYVMIDALNPAWTASAQWFERTLDDSANKRVSVAEAFLALDGILDLYINVTSGLVVYPKVIESRLMSELPFMATENIMMDAVKKGGDRQDLHERIRVHSMAAAQVVKAEGGKNDLIDRIAADPAFMMTKEEILAVMKPENYVGRAPQQTADFLNEVINPILDAEKDLLGIDVEINV